MSQHKMFSAIALALLLPACATGGAGDEGSGVPAPDGEAGPIIEIMNGAWNADDVQILIISSLGVQVELGQVAAGDTAVFSYNGEPGVYGLQTVGTTGVGRRSRSFTVVGRVHVRWDLQTGFLTTRRRRD